MVESKLSLTSYMVLDCEVKDGIESTNSKSTLLEDQRKEHEDIVMDVWEAFYHATLWNRLTSWLLRCQLLVLYNASYMYDSNDSYCRSTVGVG